MAFSRGPSIVTDGLVLALDAANHKSYPGSGTTWYDRSGNEYNGTLTNGPTFDNGNGGSIVFDGSNDYVNCGNILNITNNLTLNIWCNISNLTGGQNILTKPSQYWLHKESSTNKFRFKIEIPTRYEVEADLTLNTSQWYYIVGTYDNTSMKIYINGQYYNTTNTTGNIQITSDPLNVGSWVDGVDPFNGRIAIAQIYNRALSEQEIQQNYNATKSRFGL